MPANLCELLKKTGDPMGKVIWQEKEGGTKAPGIRGYWNSKMPGTWPLQGGDQTPSGSALNGSGKIKKKKRINKRCGEAIDFPDLLWSPMGKCKGRGGGPRVDLTQEVVFRGGGWGRKKP